jgi:FKBP-type peptidyl-prolyl cis-trans isomerase
MKTQSITGFVILAALMALIIVIGGGYLLLNNGPEKQGQDTPPPGKKVETVEGFKLDDPEGNVVGKKKVFLSKDELPKMTINIEEPELVEIEKGLKYRDLREGNGEAANASQMLTLHFNGWLPDGTLFETTRTRSPITVTMDSAIPGWTKGIPGMKPGGVRRLVIAPELAYGAQARQKVPANSIVIFDIELISAK